MSRTPSLMDGLLVVALCALAYGNALGNGFVYDDWDLIVRNGWLRQGNPFDAFRVGYWETSRGGSFYYRPIVSLSYWLDYRIWGESPFGYHLGNLVLHALCSLLVLWLARRWLRSGPAGLAAAAVFAVLPVHTQSVTWIAGRTDLLAALFLLAALALQLVAWDATGRARAVASCGAVVASALALLSKEMAVVCLPALVLQAWLVSRESGPGRLRQGWAAAAGICAATAGYLALRVAVLGRIAGTGADPHAWWTPGQGDASRLLAVPGILVFYLRRTLFPWWLGFESGIRPVDRIDLASFWAPAAGLALLGAVVWRFHPRDPAVTFGVAWFALTIAPVANVFPIFESAMEHFAYLPSVGLVVAAVAVGRALIPGRAGRIALAAALVLMAARCVARNVDWRDEESFWRVTVRDTPSARALNNLGLHLADVGRLDEAREALSRVRSLEPGLPGSYSNLGVVAARQGRRDEAAALFRKALDLDPSDADARFNLALLLEANESGERYGPGFPAQEAVQTYRALLASHPRHAEGWTNLGVLSERLGRPDEAAIAYERAIEAAPDMAEPHAFLASILWQRGQRERAAGLYRRYLTLNPEGEYASEARGRLGTDNPPEPR